MTATTSFDAATNGAAHSTPAKPVGKPKERVPYTRSDRGLWLAGFLAAVALAVTTASLLGSGDPKLAALPIAAVCGVILLYLALTRFELFVLVCLFLRSSLDSIGGEGTTVTNPASILALTFMAASLLWLAARSHRGVRFHSDLSIPLLLFTFACLLSTLTSVVRTVSITEFSRILSVVVMALVLERLATTPAAVRRIMIAAMGSAIIPLTASVLAKAAGHPLLDRRAALADGIKRVRGTFDQANGFSRYLLFVITMAVALYPHLSKRMRIVTIVGVSGLGVLMILTYTRSSWLALGVALFVVGWLQSKKLVVALIVLGLGIALFVPSVVERFTNLTQNNGPSTALTGSGNSLAWRFSYWGQIIGLASDNPVSGIGLRATEVLSGQKQPHNDFVRAYVEMGAIGLTAYLILLYSLARLARKAVKYARPGFERGIAVGFAGCCTAFILVSIAANVMSQAVVLWYFFAFAACAAAVTKFGMAEREASDVGGRPVAVRSGSD